MAGRLMPGDYRLLFTASRRIYDLLTLADRLADRASPRRPPRFPSQNQRPWCDVT
jgi:hypothetical protein